MGPKWTSFLAGHTRRLLAAAAAGGLRSLGATHAGSPGVGLHLCVLGGVALTGVLNGRPLLETEFEDFSAQPAAADGRAVGAALEVTVGENRPPCPRTGHIRTGPDRSEAELDRLTDEGTCAHRRPSRRRVGGSRDHRLTPHKR